MAKLDVRIKLYRDGALIRGGDITADPSSDVTAVLGKAKLGKMLLGKT